MAAVPMPDDTKPPPSAPARAKTQPPAASAAAVKPVLDERRLRFADLAPLGKQLDLGELAELARDGRAIARANAALGFAAAGHAALDLVTLLRDSELPVALAAAE